jgi:hypothetical protein
MSDTKVINLSNILKNESIITLNDYEKYKLNEEYNKLYTNSNIANNEINEKKYNERFYNLSLKDIFNNLIKTLVDILNDLSNYIENKNKDKIELLEIFIKKERLIYVGVFLIIISLMLFFINISS